MMDQTQDADARAVARAVSTLIRDAVLRRAIAEGVVVAPHAMSLSSAPIPARRYYPLDEAAPLLGTTVGALKRRCVRAARRAGHEIVAQLGDGVVAVKMGRGVRAPWRVKFPERA